MKTSDSSSHTAKKEVSAAMNGLVENTRGDRFILGMQWTALVGSNPQKAILNFAKSLRATHYILSSAMPRVGACVRLASRQPATHEGQRLKRLHSFAAMFALTHPQGVQVCLPIDHQGGCWLIASKDGQVLCSTDRYFESRQAASEVISELKLRYPSLMLSTATLGAPEQLPHWLNGDLSDASTVVKISLLHRYSSAMLLSLSVMAIVFAYLWWLPNRKSTVELAGFVQGPVHFRESTLEASYPTRLVDVNGALWSRIKDWSALPVVKSGWRLSEIDCLSADSGWQCRANYRRLNKHARHQDLRNLGDKFENLRFENLNQAIVEWQDQQTLSISPLDGQTLSRGIDQLQVIESAFETIDVGPIDSRPEGSRRILRLSGPLRSVLLLNQLQVPIRWTRVSIHSLNLPVNQASLTRSALQVVVEGDLYVD